MCKSSCCCALEFGMAGFDVKCLTCTCLMQLVWQPFCLLLCMLTPICMVELHVLGLHTAGADKAGRAGYPQQPDQQLGRHQHTAVPALPQRSSQPADTATQPGRPYTPNRAQPAAQPYLTPQRSSAEWTTTNSRSNSRSSSRSGWICCCRSSSKACCRGSHKRWQQQWAAADQLAAAIIGLQPFAGRRQPCG